MGFFDFGQRRRTQRLVDALYAKAVAQARQPVFYDRGAVPDSVDGRFDLLVLHMFLLLHRLGAEGAEGRALAQKLFDLMFADMDQSLREMGVSDMSVGKRVKEMARAFYGRVEAYQAGLGDAAGLEAALARNLYRGSEVAPETVKGMSRYVTTQVERLAELDLARIAAPDTACFTAPVL
jgi:cytochrome b pre-mRNA-processing protein 3